MKPRLTLIALLFGGLLIPVHAPAADHSGVMPFVTADVAAIGYIDLTAIDTSAMLDEVNKLGILPPDQSEMAKQASTYVQGWLRMIVGGGATRAYVLLRASDLQHAGPTWVLPLSGDADSSQVIGLVRNQFPGPAWLPRHFRTVDGALLAAASEAQLEMVATQRARPPRPDVAAAMAKLGGADLGLVVVGDADSRRVLREMFPRLPAPFDQLDGRMIADDLLWGGLVIDLPPETKASIHIETARADVAQRLQQAAVKGLQLAKQSIASQAAHGLPEGPELILKSLELLQPKVEGTSVQLTVGESAEELAQIRNLLAPPLSAAREAARRSQRVNQFKQIALAFWNYESANKVFVQRANYDESGRPLLSWRVHLLPYLEDSSLYDEFRLDEPWDSEHNRKLIARMPEIYADPDPAVRRAVGGVGRTTFVAPVAAETVFPPRDELPDGAPLKVRDVRDGTSKTILFVEVVPERAVVWTKPDDWEVDLDHPLQGVRRADRADWVAARCDGSVQSMSNDVPAGTLRALLTRDGGESVNE